MKTILLVLISAQLWRAPAHSKPAAEPCGLGGQPLEKSGNNTQSKNNGTEKPSRRYEADVSYANKYLATGPLGYGLNTRIMKTKATTTTKILLDNDCDYINYYCMRGYYTGHICARTMYNTYDTFTNYCELEYVNCMEQYDLWTIAHMGSCFNVSGYQAFAYYAYAVWDDNQLEEIYSMPTP